MKIELPGERRARQREEMRQAILETARQVMREQGVAALSLNEVARRVGVKTPSLYEYFPSKQALYDALFRLGLRSFSERLDGALSGVTDSWERLRLAIESYMRFAQEVPELFGIVFERQVPGFTPSEAAMTESRERLDVARKHLEEAIHRGDIVSSASTAQTLDLVLALMHGLASSHLANEPELPVGRGRFGSLIPFAMDVLRKAWEVDSQPEDRRKGK